MNVDSSSGEDPIDLDAGRAAITGRDALAAALFRNGLEPDEEQVRRLRAALPRIQAQARRSRRLRVVVSGSLAVAATAAAVVVLILPGAPNAGVVSPADPPGIPSPTSTEPVRISRSSLLPTTSITAFGTGTVVRDSGPEDTGGQAVVAGVCVDLEMPGLAPSRAWQASWRSAEPPASSFVPPGLVERVWQWDDDGQAASDLIDQLDGQVADCASEPGMEGRGAVVRLDAPQELAQADRALITAASDGQGNQAVQVVMSAGDLVVQLDAVLPQAGQDSQNAPELALWTLAPTARAALTRAITGTEGAAR